MITLKKYFITNEWEDENGGCDHFGEEIEFEVPFEQALKYACRFAEKDFGVNAKALESLVLELDVCDQLIEYYEEKLGDYLCPDEE